MKKFNDQSELIATANTAKAPVAKTAITLSKLIILTTIEKQKLEDLQYNKFQHQQAAVVNQVGVVGAFAVAAPLKAQSDGTSLSSTAAEVAAAVKTFHIENFNLIESLGSFLNSSGFYV
ncbi:unnamed protein product [Ceratitis capitata]|uniref:(Mediterranean fruit fly) hypothetical protein n=1 Tax=Ceratitis capitata TaxID=7213 RepID=W8BWK4_CERCA|nr:unnamed protein product [Ceratitis capitata]